MDYYHLKEIEILEDIYIDNIRGSKILKKEIKSLKLKIDNIKEAIVCLVTVLNIGQKGVINFIEGIVGSSLRQVYGKKYGFELKYELKRNQPEIYMSIIKDGVYFEPKYDCGIGISDVTAFALRLALWTLYEPRTSSVLIFDEPMKNCHGKIINEKIGAMIKKLSKELEVQIIIVSGEEGLLDFADKGFEVKQSKGISHIKEI